MKNIFSAKLYVEGLKKLRVAGFLGGILACAAALIACVSSTPDTTVTNFAHALLPLFVLAPTTIISVFSFLNKRKGSDFYHSLPASRTCMFTSFFLAAFTYTAAATVVCFLLCASICVPFGGFTPDAILCLLPAYLCACFLLSGIAALAVSATGTFFAAATVSILFAIVPAFFMELICRFLDTTVTSFVPSASLISPFTLSNSVFGAIFTFTGEASSLLYQGWFFLFSFAVGVAFFFASLFVYRKRKSEWATKGAPNAKLRAVYRLLATIPLLIFSLYDLLLKLFNSPEIIFTKEDTVSFIFILIITVVWWFLFELIFTRSFKTAILSFGRIYLLPVGCGLFLLTALLSREAILKFNPTEKQVAGVSIDFSSASALSLESANVSNIFVSDNEIEKIICDGLKKTNLGNKEWLDNLHSNGYSDRYIYYKGYVPVGPSVNVRITLNWGLTVTRRVSLYDIKCDDLMYQCALKSDKFMEKYLLLPSGVSRASFYWFGDGFDSADTGINASDIWNAFLSDYDSLTNEQKLEVKRSRYNIGDYDNMPRLNATLGDYGFLAYIPEYMKNTRQCFLYLTKYRADRSASYIFDMLYRFDKAGYTDQHGRPQEPYILTGGSVEIATDGALVSSLDLHTVSYSRLMEIFDVLDDYVYSDAMRDKYPLAGDSFIAVTLKWKEYFSASEKTCTVAVAIDKEKDTVLYGLFETE